MVVTINSAYDLCDYFRKWNRDYFSIDGYQYFLDFYPESHELDIPSICEEWTEYGNLSMFDFHDLVTEYGYMYPLEDTVYEDETDEDYLKELARVLDRRTLIIWLDNGDILLRDF